MAPRRHASLIGAKFRRLTSCIAVLGLVVAGCTRSDDGTIVDAPTQSTDAEEASTTVDDDGFELTLGSVTARGPAGVAAPGTHVKLQHIPSPSEVARAGPELAAPAFKIVFDGDLVPEAPVELVLNLDEPPSSNTPLAFAGMRSGKEVWTGQPVVIDGATALVSLEDPSVGVFSWAGPLVDDMASAWADRISTPFPAPDCVEPPETSLVKVDGGNAHPCLEAHGGEEAVLSLHSNSPYPWRVLGGGTAIGHTPKVPNGLTGGGTAAAYEAMVGGDYTVETLVGPGGSVRLSVDSGPTETSLILERSSSLDAIAAALAMMEGVVGEVSRAEEVEIGRCLGDVWTVSSDVTFEDVLVKGVACAGPTVDLRSNFLLSMASSVAPALAPAVEEFLSEPPGTDTLVATFRTEKAADEDSLSTVEGLDVSSFDFVDFSSPSGGIQCSMRAGSAMCHLPADIDQSKLPDSDGFCGPHFGLAGVGAGDHTGWICSGGVLASPDLGFPGTQWFDGTGWPTATFETSMGPNEYASLPYGESLVMGTLSCSSAEDGVRCQRSDSGAGFWVARRGVEMYGPQVEHFFDGR